MKPGDLCTPDCTVDCGHCKGRRKSDDIKRALCPRGFVPRTGFGNQRICATCGRFFDDHVVVVQ